MGRRRGHPEGLGGGDHPARASVGDPAAGCRNPHRWFPHRQRHDQPRCDLVPGSDSSAADEAQALAAADGRP